jgi:hypothetical protein
LLAKPASPPSQRPETLTLAYNQNPNTKLAILFEQNNEKATRKFIRATVVGSARVMSYEDIVKAQKQRDIKEAAAEIS